MEYRVSTSQLHEMLEHLATHLFLVKGPGLGARGQEVRDREWQKLAQRLNAHGSGSSKSATRWKRYWADLKHKVKARASARKRSHHRTGGGPSGKEPLTDIEKKVLHIIGEEALNGDHIVGEEAKNGDHIVREEAKNGDHILGEKAKNGDHIVREEAKNGDHIIGEEAINGDHIICEEAIKGDIEHTLPIFDDEEMPDSPVIVIGSPTPKRLRRIYLKKASAPPKSLDTSMILEMERRRVKAEEKLADAAMIAAEAAKVQSNASLVMAEAFINLTNILDQLVKKE